MTGDWLDEIEAQADATSPHYLPRLIAEIRRLRALVPVEPPPSDETPRLTVKRYALIEHHHAGGHYGEELWSQASMDEREDGDFVRWSDYEALARTQLADPPCGGCGGPHLFDTSIDSGVWNRVVRPLGGSEHLCLSCIVQIFAAQGEAFTAKCYGSGHGLNGLEIRFGRPATCRTCVQLRPLKGDIHQCPVVNIRIHNESADVFGCNQHQATGDAWPE